MIGAREGSMLGAWTESEEGRHDSPLKVKPKHLERPLLFPRSYCVTDLTLVTNHSSTRSRRNEQLWRAEETPTFKMTSAC